MGKSTIQRYSEKVNLPVISGDSIVQAETLEDLSRLGPEGDLDVDLAEASLGERLAARTGVEGIPNGASGSDEEADAASRTKQGDKAAVPAHSLARTLIQALHSEDAVLLEKCLQHSNEAIIRRTVQKLPPELAAPLITACFERLGRGGNAGNLKGKGGGAGPQRGLALVHWIRAALMIHSAHLMTMQDLVARLSGLHSILTSRLSLQDRLLSLSGRLDLALYQVEHRSSNAPAPLTTSSKKSDKLDKKTAKERNVYVEEDESEDEEGVDVMEAEETGSVEDVELGDESEDDDEEEESDDDDEDDEDGKDGRDRLVNGFIDDEAVESDDEDSDYDSS